MPLYEYRCRECATVFEARRQAGEANDAVACPAGHGDTVRLLSTFATIARGAATPAAAGGCCGGGCACR